jgi:LAS superfamily LD-carboxypeptidase LdcB
MIRFYTLVLLFLCNITSAEIYKCVNESGELKYQSEKCKENEQSKIMTVRQVQPTTYQEPKLKHVTKNSKFDENRNKKATEKVLKKQLAKQKKKECNLLRKKFKREEQRVIDRCKKNYETFCDLPASTIAKNERKKAIRQITNSRGSGTVRIPASSLVEVLKKELKKQGCK